MTNNHIHRRGLGLRDQVKDKMATDFSSSLIDRLRNADYQFTHGDLTIKLAREFGFCYGVERSIDYAYQTIEKFPDRRIFLTDEIIHNPSVNQNLIEKGLRFLSGPYQQDITIENLTSEDVVVLPAFGIEKQLLNRLQKIGCIIVGTTCGSVLNVWKFIRQASRQGFTIILHGKPGHQEVQAALSQTDATAKRHYLIIPDRRQAEIVCSFIRSGNSDHHLITLTENSASDSFDPTIHLQKIAFAHQTTMLASESVEISSMFREAMAHRYGQAHLDEHFRMFDSICHATQQRQDALIELLDSGVDLMIIIGGYNSSNTSNLTRIASQYAPSFHIEDDSALISRHQIRHKIEKQAQLQMTKNWLPGGSIMIGITGGASTPYTIMAAVIRRILFLYHSD